MGIINLRTRAVLILLFLCCIFLAIVASFAYRETIIGGTFILGVQSFVIIGLIVNRFMLKRTEEQLRQSEERFREITNKVPIALFCADKDENIIFNNDKFIELFGYTSVEIPTINAWMEQVLDERDNIDAMNQLLTDMKNNEYKKDKLLVVPHPLPCHCRDGTTREIEFTLFMDGEYTYLVFADITESKAIEEALWSSRETFSLATELAHVGPWKYNAETNLFEFSDEFYAIYGTDALREGHLMAPQEYADQFIHPEDAWIVEAEIAKVFSSTERCHSVHLEHRIIRRDGVIRTVVVRANVIRDAAGKVIKWYGANQDITDRRTMEEELRTSRDTFSLAAEQAKLGPWKYDAETSLFEFGDEFYRIYGTNVAWEGAHMAPEVYAREFLHPDDEWIVKAEIDKVLCSEESYSNNLEYRIIRRDGEVRTIVSRSNVIRNEFGKIVQWYGANQDITEHKRAEEALHRKSEEIKRMAYTDVLTGLPNRAHLNERLDQEMEQVRRGESSGVVLFIDVDDLKTVNDTLGHTYGDVIIIEAGKRIAAEVGQGAFVARIGGDEFLVILPGERNREYIARLADRIIGALCQSITVFGVGLHLSASAGAAIYPDDGNTAEEIFKNADNAMYAAKNTGKNCWAFYDTDMQAAAYERMLLTNSLRHAVERRELVLHYQPQVGTVDGVIVGFEALLRWNSPEHGSISPTRFIPLAEQSGLIHVIGDWVLREACQFARRLVDQGLENIYIAVNVSPHQLCAGHFVDTVGDALHSTGIAPWQLEIEITENALIASLDEGICKLGELQAMGVRLALDDFGTGYSSLTYLQRLPVKTLKIDKSFMDTIMIDGTNKAIIRSIVEMAHVMEMSVVAEGVETEQQKDYLTQCGCDLLQGYIISHPVPEDIAIGLISRGN